MNIIPFDNRLFGPLHETLGRWFHEPLFSHDNQRTPVRPHRGRQRFPP